MILACLAELVRALRPSLACGPELTLNGCDDIFCDTLYTGAVWQVIRDQVAADRAIVGLNLLKQLY